MKKGFTLIELLIVIGILAVLAAATILVLNPAELFAQARDSQRISDLGSLQSALGLYISTANPIALGNTADCYTYLAGVAINCAGRHLGVTTITASRAVGGAGWVPVNFSGIPGGSPLGNLPVDPTDASVLFYSYAPGAGNVFELDANMESARYRAGGSNDVTTNDGGSSTTVYEVGTATGLAL